MGKQELIFSGNTVDYKGHGKREGYIVQSFGTSWTTIVRWFENEDDAHALSDKLASDNIKLDVRVESCW